MLLINDEHKFNKKECCINITYLFFTTLLFLAIPITIIPMSLGNVFVIDVSENKLLLIFSLFCCLTLTVLTSIFMILVPTFSSTNEIRRFHYIFNLIENDRILLITIKFVGLILSNIIVFISQFIGLILTHEFLTYESCAYGYLVLIVISILLYIIYGLIKIKELCVIYLIIVKEYIVSNI